MPSSDGKGFFQLLWVCGWNCLCEKILMVGLLLRPDLRSPNLEIEIRNFANAIRLLTIPIPVFCSANAWRRRGPALHRSEAGSDSSWGCGAGRPTGFANGRRGHAGTCSRHQLTDEYFTFCLPKSKSMYVLICTSKVPKWNKNTARCKYRFAWFQN